jgi:gliding motility-associated-like protein
MDWFLLKADTLCSCEFSDTSNYNTDPPHIKPDEEPKPVLLIPNIFSPNGDDQNDLFFIRGPEIESVDLSIYNRWGNKVFETKDKAFGWDGKQNGMECEVGIYAYMVAITFSNGQSLIKKGNVSLVR